MLCVCSEVTVPSLDDRKCGHFEIKLIIQLIFKQP